MPKTHPKDRSPQQKKKDGKPNRPAKDEYVSSDEDESVEEDRSVKEHSDENPDEADEEGMRTFGIR